MNIYPDKRDKKETKIVCSKKQPSIIVFMTVFIKCDVYSHVLEGYKNILLASLVLSQVMKKPLQFLGSHELHSIKVLKKSRAEKYLTRHK